MFEVGTHNIGKGLNFYNNRIYIIIIMESLVTNILGFHEKKNVPISLLHV